MGLGWAQFRVQFLLSTLSAPTNYYVAGLLQPNQMELTSDDHRDDAFFHQGHDDQARSRTTVVGSVIRKDSSHHGVSGAIVQYTGHHLFPAHATTALSPHSHTNFLLPPEITNPILTPHPLQDVTWRRNAFKSVLFSPICSLGGAYTETD